MISVVSFFTPIDDGGMPECWSTITKLKVETPFNLTIFDEPLVPNFGVVLGVVQSLRGRGGCLVQELQYFVNVQGKKCPLRGR